MHMENVKNTKYQRYHFLITLVCVFFFFLTIQKKKRFMFLIRFCSSILIMYIPLLSNKHLDSTVMYNLYPYGGQIISRNNSFYFLVWKSNWWFSKMNEIVNIVKLSKIVMEKKYIYAIIYYTCIFTFFQSKSTRHICTFVHMNVHVFHFAHVKNSLLTKSFNIIRLA